jgi:hypothetical protein
MSDRTTNIVMGLQTTMLGIITVVVVAGLPWAYIMQGRVSSIETNTEIYAERTKEMAADIKSQTINSSRIDELGRRLDRMEAKLP